MMKKWHFRRHLEEFDGTLARHGLRNPVVEYTWSYLDELSCTSVSILSIGEKSIRRGKKVCIHLNWGEREREREREKERERESESN